MGVNCGEWEDKKKRDMQLYSQQHYIHWDLGFLLLLLL